MLNTSPDPLSATIAVPAQPPGIASFSIYTSGAANYWQTSTVPVISATAVMTVPGYGVVTLYGLAPPLLSARLGTPGRLALSWGQAAVGFVLQSTPDLGQSASWNNDTNARAIANGVATVSAAITTNPRFYRLVLPISESK